jgi:hypothetical protein
VLRTHAPHKPPHDGHWGMRGQVERLAALVTIDGPVNPIVPKDLLSTLTMLTEWPPTRNGHSFRVMAGREPGAEPQRPANPSIGRSRTLTPIPPPLERDRRAVTTAPPPSQPYPFQDDATQRAPPQVSVTASRWSSSHGPGSGGLFVIVIESTTMSCIVYQKL